FMPPKGERLTPEQIVRLERWIDNGAHWPEKKDVSEAATAEKQRVITDQERQFWAFQPPHRHVAQRDSSRAWAREPLDQFVVARLRERGLEPSSEAAPAVFLRRLTFDLTGLPPTPDELDEFLSA